MNIQRGVGVSSLPLLLCEGPSDERLLRRIFDNREVLPEQVNGERNLGPVSAYWRISRRRIAFTIRDRNFASLEEAEACFAPDYNRFRFLWRRHELENYFLEPRVIINCLEKLRWDIRSTVELPGTEDEATNLLKQIAGNLIEDQAGRRTAWLLHQQLRKEIPLAFSIGQPKTIEDRAVWEEYLLNEGKKIRNQAPQIKQLVQMNDDYILRRYEESCQIFSASEFIETNQYIRDFGGHEMVRQLYDNFDFMRRRYRLQDFENDLANSFVEEWNRDSSFLQPNDFDDLRNAIVRLGGTRNI